MKYFNFNRVNLIIELIILCLLPMYCNMAVIRVFQE
jgi:hypothetical protein